jgi:hypothetical protein
MWRLGLVLMAWWVVANLQPVLGPFDSEYGCSQAAFQYGVANHTFAYCRMY